MYLIGYGTPYQTQEEQTEDVLIDNNHVIHPETSGIIQETLNRLLIRERLDGSVVGGASGSGAVNSGGSSTSRRKSTSCGTVVVVVMSS